MVWIKGTFEGIRACDMSKAADEEAQTTAAEPPDAEEEGRRVWWYWSELAPGDAGEGDTVADIGLARSIDTPLPTE